MQAAFLIIISIGGSIYALFTRQSKISLGLLVLAISFVFAIPDLVTGVWADIFGALTMILFAVGTFILVFKKKKVVSGEESVKEDEKVIQ